MQNSLEKNFLIVKTIKLKTQIQKVYGLVTLIENCPRNGWNFAGLNFKPIKKVYQRHLMSVYKTSIT